MKPVHHQKAFEIPKDWDVKAKLLRRRFPQLTQSDLKFENNEENLLERIEKRLGKKRDEVIELIKNTIPNKFINNLKIQYHE